MQDVVATYDRFCAKPAQLPGNACTVLIRALILLGLGFTLSAQAQVWHPLPPLPTPRYAAAAASLNGSIYVIGGVGAHDSLLATVEAYDPARRTWRTLPPLEEPRAYAAAVVLNDRLYLIGGLEGETMEEAEATDEVLVFQPEIGWKKVASLQEARYGLAAVVFEGQLYAIGGSMREKAERDRPLLSIEAYDPLQNTWQSVAAMPVPISLTGAAVVDKEIYIFGGVSGNIPLALIHRFQPTSGSVMKLPAPLPQEWWAGAVLTYQNEIILLGGLGGAQGMPLSDVFALQLQEENLSLRKLPPLQQARFSFAAATYNDTLFVFGGLSQTGGAPLNSAEAASAAILTPRESPALPADFSLDVPYPHPFREQVTLTFSVSTRLPGTPVQLAIHDLLGRPVIQLLHQPLPPGHYTLHWDGTDAAGHPVPGGVYLVRLTQGPYHQERLLIRIR